VAYKAFNRLVNGEVRARAVELPIGKLNVFSKLINSIKCRSWCRIVVWPWFCVLKVIIKLFKSYPAYIFFDDIF